MMKRKQSVSAVLALLLVFTLCVGPLTGGMSAKADVYDIYTYSIWDGAVTITDCDDTARGSIEIPSEIAGYPVTEIGWRAFQSCPLLTSVTIPNGVTMVGAEAFWGCSSLTSLDLPKSVDSIGHGAFSDCTNLRRVNIDDLNAWCQINFVLPESNPLSNDAALYVNGTLLTELNFPDNITVVGDHAFAGCRSLQSVIIPENVTDIGENAFYGCSSLASVSLPKSLTSIGRSAFYGCGALTSIAIPNGVISIGEDAFRGCSNLHRVDIDDLNSWWKIEFSGRYNNPLSNGASLYVGGTLLTELIFPENITAIGDYAFAGCQSLQNITIPEQVADIGNGAFTDCTSLASLTLSGRVLSDSADSIGNGAFSGCPNLRRVNIDDFDAWCQIDFASRESNPLHRGASLYVNGTLLTELNLSENMTAIGDYALVGCKSLKSAVIPEQVADIGKGAFAGCDRLTEVILPRSITSIHDEVFDGCYELASVSLPDTLTSIGVSAFYGCGSLKSIDFPKSVTSIGGSAFCASGLEVVALPDGVTEISPGVFSYCSSLKDVTMPEGVTVIGDYAFMDCTALARVNIPEGVISIGEAAFQHNAFTEIELPEGLQSIAHGAFYSCNIHHIRIPNSVARITGMAFGYCNRLTSAVIPENGMYIADEAFDHCGRLTIYSEPGGTVQDYAEYNGIPFASWERVSSIAIAALPDILSYSQARDTLDVTGGKITRYRYNGVSDEINLTADMVSGFDNTVAGKQTLTVTCDGQTADFEVEILARNLTSIALTALPSDLAYLEGADLLDVSGGRLRLTYDNGTAEEISLTADMVSGFDNTVVGKQRLTVAYGDFTTAFEIEITAKSLTSIAVAALPFKRIYFKGMDSLDLTGGVISLTYNNGTTEVMDMTFDMVSGFDNTVVGCQTLTVSYGGFTDTFEVEIKPAEKSLISIAVTTLPSKLTYLEGEDALDVTGGKLTLTYDDDTAEVISLTADMVSGFDHNVAGKQTLTVTYGGLTTSFEVTVQSSAPSSITSDQYTIADGIISGIPAGTTVSDLMDGINEKQYISVLQGNGEVTGDTLIGTGMVVQLMNDGDVVASAKTIVAGDNTGDGRIDTVDALQVLQHSVDLIRLEDGPFMASDINGDQQITAVDALYILQFVVGLIDSLN